MLGETFKKAIVQTVATVFGELPAFNEVILELGLLVVLRNVFDRRHQIRF